MDKATIDLIMTKVEDKKEEIKKFIYPGATQEGDFQKLKRILRNILVESSVDLKKQKKTVNEMLEDITEPFTVNNIISNPDDIRTFNILNLDPNA